MNAIDTNLYNYLDERWRTQYDSWSNNPAGYQSFADVMASSAEGQLYLDQLFSTGAISASMYTGDVSGAESGTAAATDETGQSGGTEQTGQTEGSTHVAENFYDFTQGDWQARHPDKMALYDQAPGMGVFLANFPEYGSLFVNGTLEDAQAARAAYELSYARYTASHGLDLTA